MDTLSKRSKTCSICVLVVAYRFGDGNFGTVMTINEER